MTEKEVLDKQEQAGNSEFFLILIGRFYHAYGNGAFALSRITGYHVRRKQRKMGEVLVLGFPIDLFDSVRDRVRDAGGEMEPIDGKTWKFHGIDGTPDLSMVSEPKPESGGQPEFRVHDRSSVAYHATTDSWLEDAVRHFDLSMATPMDAMLFVNSLKQRLRRQKGCVASQKDGDSEFACESPPG